VASKGWWAAVPPDGLGGNRGSLPGSSGDAVPELGQPAVLATSVRAERGWQAAERSRTPHLTPNYSPGDYRVVRQKTDMAPTRLGGHPVSPSRGVLVQPAFRLAAELDLDVEHP
jgi:hypothetical protein